jgi:hypothetical protein
MYLENWMIVALILSFGACAFFSRRGGFVLGATMTLKALEEQRIIKIEDDGQIKRWAPYNDAPVKKITKTRKK